MYCVAVYEAWGNVSRDFFNFFRKVEPENIAIFIAIPKADGLLLLNVLSVFEEIGQKVRDDFIFLVFIDTDIFEDFWRLAHVLFIVDDNVNLSGARSTVAEVQVLSTVS